MIKSLEIHNTYMIPPTTKAAVASGIKAGYRLSHSSELTFLINDKYTIRNTAMETFTPTSSAPMLNHNLEQDTKKLLIVTAENC